MLDLFAQGFVQSGLENIQGGRCHSFSGQPAQKFHHSDSWDFFPYVEIEFPSLQSHTDSNGPLSAYLVAMYFRVFHFRDSPINMLSWTGT